MEIIKRVVIRKRINGGLPIHVAVEVKNPQKKKKKKQ